MKYKVVYQFPEGKIQSTHNTKEEADAEAARINALRERNSVPGQVTVEPVEK